MGKNREVEQMQALDELIGQALIDNVLGVIKSGKEATVYLCERGDDLVAAKVYRATSVRGFADDAVYRQGRRHGESRVQRAIEQKSSHGRGVAFAAWVAAEYETLRILHAGGAAVPRPFARSETIVLMEYLGDDDAPAPPLASVRLEREEAEAAFRSLLETVELALANDRVHGDLSAYNALWWQGRPVVIDFPQAVDPRVNTSALTLLERDIDRICAYFERYGIIADAGMIARGLWGRFLRSEL